MGDAGMSEKRDYLTVLGGGFFIVTVFLSGFFYYQLTRTRALLTQNQSFIEDFQEEYQELHDNYLTLLNTTLSVEDYYMELQDRYSTLRSEYSDLESRYSNLQQDNIALRGEFDDVMNLGKSMVLEDNRTLDLSAGGNTTLSYDTVFAGYIEVNFTSSTEIYIWVGSSVTEDEYYARYPAYPDTAVDGTFRIPMCAKVYVYITNSNEEMGSTVNLSIKYVY